MSRKTLLFVGIALAIILFDQATKFWVYYNILQYQGEIPVIPGFFSIVHAQNPGAALGLLGDFTYRRLFFIGFTFFAVAILVDLYRKLRPDEVFISGTLGLILGGAVGNLVDRVHKGTVTDFLRFYSDYPPLKEWLIGTFGTYEYPSFNIADSALVVGVGLFLVHYLFLEDADPDEDTAEPPPEDAQPPADSDTTPVAEG